MSISIKDRKLLWTKAGNRCSYRYKGFVCDKELIKTDEGKDVITGIECHIVDRNHFTTRYRKNFLNKDTYDNLILLCDEHHTLIDSNGDIYNIEVLKKMKDEHEKSVTERLKTKEITPIEIRDSVFDTEVKDAEEAIGMEVNRPAVFSNVRSTLIASDVKRAVGFSTNQGLSAITIMCSCNKPFSVLQTGPRPLSVNCPHCKKEHKL